MSNPGVVVTDFGPDASGLSVALQPDRKILVAGSASQQLVVGQTFIANTAPVASTTTGTFLYDTSDQDSNGGVPQQIAHFDSAAALKADDFNIVAWNKDAAMLVDPTSSYRRKRRISHD